MKLSFKKSWMVILTVLALTFSVSGTITLGSTLPTVTVAGGALTINGSGQTIIISGNTAVKALFVATGTSLTVQNLTIANGHSVNDGGGIYNAGTLIITNSTFSGNSANGGGGIYNIGTLTITNSTFSGNSTVNFGGGGIYNIGTLTITNSTFSGNGADSGGGIYANGGTATITNSTFSDNGAPGGGGIRQSGGTVTLRNTIVANSTSGGDCSGTVTDGGNNIVEDNTCGFTGGADPNLGALTGSPAYFPLNAGSPAIAAEGITNGGTPRTDMFACARIPSRQPQNFGFGIINL